MQLIKILNFSLVFLFSKFLIILCSEGDKLSYYVDCLQYCFYKNCSTISGLNQFQSQQSNLLKFMGWNCEEECSYNCQWHTINYLIEDKKTKNLPQFYGKWTFKRFFGMQEPASAIFSLFNLVTYYISYKIYLKNIFKFSNKKHKNSKEKVKFLLEKENFLNLLNAFAAFNAWFWSIIFHCKDFVFTEKMDYFSAFLFVITSFTLSLIKLLDELSLTKKNYLQSSIFILITSFCIYYENYILFERLDYQFNMKVNILLGFSSTLFWIIWCIIRYKKYKTFYLFKCFISLILMNFFLIFEIFDFPPLFYIFDAHSIWHLGTIILPFIWYSFLIDEYEFKLTLDMKYLNLKSELNYKI